jgi:hypothetical protein
MGELAVDARAQTLGMAVQVEEEEEDFTRFANRQGFRKCKQCGRRIEKAGGCDKVRCVCGYRCGSSHYIARRLELWQLLITVPLLTRPGSVGSAALPMPNATARQPTTASSMPHSFCSQVNTRHIGLME